MLGSQGLKVYNYVPSRKQKRRFRGAPDSHKAEAYWAPRDVRKSARSFSFSALQEAINPSKHFQYTSHCTGVANPTSFSMSRHLHRYANHFWTTQVLTIERKAYLFREGFPEKFLIVKRSPRSFGLNGKRPKISYVGNAFPLNCMLLTGLVLDHILL